MNKGLLTRLLTCIFFLGFLLYSYIEKQNQLTQLRICIPELAKDVKQIREENTRLQYEIDQFENPQHLMELARHGEFTHLKHPLLKEILTCQEGIALQPSTQNVEKISQVKAKPTLAIRN